MQFDDNHFTDEVDMKVPGKAITLCELIACRNQGFQPICLRYWFSLALRQLATADKVTKKAVYLLIHARSDKDGIVYKGVRNKKNAYSILGQNTRWHNIQGVMQFDDNHFIDEVDMKMPGKAITLCELIAR